MQKAKNLFSNTSPSKRNMIIAVVIGLLVLVAGWQLINSWAAGSSGSIEAEEAVLAGGATLVNDSGASKGKAIQFGTTVLPPNAVRPTKLISRGLPAFATSGTASYGNDASYNTVWQSSSSNASLTYDLASVPSAQRSSVLLVWYNEASVDYDPAMAQEAAVNIPLNYTVQTNSAASGSSAPTSGWVTKVTVNSNKYHSRQHVIDMTGANWVRLSVTSTFGGSKASLNMDVYDASQGLDDDWIVYGESVPSMALQHDNIGNVTQSFSQMVNASKPDYFPVQENGAISGLDTSNVADNINGWLAMFPGKYVGIAVGANDADECVTPTEFYNNNVKIINAILNAGKVPIVSQFSYGKLSTVMSCGPALIATYPQLFANNPQVIQGPDFWTYFKNHQDQLGSDNLHPNETGLANYRQMWAQTALSSVYH